VTSATWSAPIVPHVHSATVVPARLPDVENTVEVRYAGVVVDRSAMVRDRDANGAFVALAEPLPVGTAVTLKVGDTPVEARVVEVIESADLSLAGMRVRFAAAGTVAPTTGPPGEPPPSSPAGASGADDDAGSADAGALPGPTTVGDPGSQPAGGGGGGRRRRRRR
jgi:hypothetical protein